jgi:hypothetical protein
MKKVLFSSLLIGFGASVNAQNRLVLAERFSQASCGPCAAQNPAFKTLIDANSTKAISMKYQTSWPGVDPMNAQNPIDVQTRVDYYAISGVPDTRQDGADVTMSQSTIDSRYAVVAPFNIALTHTFSSDYDSIFVTANLSAFTAYSGVNTKFRLAMIEREVDFATPPGSNGELSFHNVMRKMYPNATGTAIADTWTIGLTQTITFGMPIPSYIYKLTEVGFIAFIQEEGTKEIHQAAISTPLSVNNNLSDITLLSNVTPFFCASTLNGHTATLRNDGSNVITSANVFYSLDNGVAVSTPFTGSIAPASTSVFSLPGLTGLASGSHTLRVWMQNVNGVVGNGQIGNISKSFSSFPSAGSGSPVAQNFSVTAFPYANYTVTGPNLDLLWARGAANGGSIKYDNFNFAAGSKSDFILPPVDMSALIGASLSFDVAYVQYDNSTAPTIDKLQVLVSQDCGLTWTNVYDKAGSVLSTAPVLTTSFTPTASQWRKEFVSLTPIAGATKAFVKFVATSDFGNNLWVDNINLSASAAINTEELSEINVYPNPASDLINIEFEGKGGSYKITLTDLTGRVVSTKTMTDAFGTQKSSVNTSEVENGNYLLTITNGGFVSTKQISVFK